MRYIIFSLCIFFNCQLIGQYNHYYGSLHSHTAYSDGNKDSLTSGYTTPAQNFSYVKQSYHVDYWGISDHNHYLAGMKTPQNYRSGIASANAAIINGTFVSLYGMEWGVISGGGHIITYGIDSLVGWDKQADNITNDYDIYCAKNDYTGYWNILNARPASFSTLAHPQTGDYGNIAGTAFNSIFDKVIFGSAIRNGSASSATTNYTDNTPATSYEPYWQSLLAKGYHLGPNMDADNHYTNLGRHNRCRTGVLATTLTRANIIDAFKNRRFYATEDWNAQVNFSVNGNVMGSIITTASNSAITVTASDGDVADVISNIQIWFGVPGSGVTATLLTQNNGANTLSFTHPTTVGNQFYYYAKIIEADGDIIWSAPIWVTKLAALPIHEINCTAMVKKEMVQLNWSVNATDGIINFTIEKSRDGLQFNSIGTVIPSQALNNSAFMFTDSFPEQGAQYYRIKAKLMQDNYYSNTIPVYFSVPFLTLLSAYPNPVKDVFQLQIRSKINTSLQAVIYTIGTGREVFRQKLAIHNGINYFSIATAFLPGSNYILVLSKPNERVMEIPFTKL